MTLATNQARNDDAADTGQFLSRLGYVLVAIGVPVGAVLHDLAVFITYGVAVAAFVLSAMIDPPGGLLPRMSRTLAQPIVLISLALLAWAGVSVLWTPFAIPAAQHLLKLSLWLVSLFLVLTSARAHARATDLYLFPIGVVAGLAAMLAGFIANRYGFEIPHRRIHDGAVVLVTTLYPAMGGLAARGRNGLGRLLLMLSVVAVYALGSPSLILAMLFGFAALSFAVSDMGRTSRDFAWGVGGMMALGPLVVILVFELARATMNSGLTALGGPLATLALAHAMVIHEKLLLVTGHGFESLVRALQTGLFSPATPRGQLFAIWYELGVVGAALTAAGIGIGFRRIGSAPPRLAPYLAAALACNLTLAALGENLGDMLWTVSLGVAAISAQVAERSQYRTTRPSASGLALF